MWDFLGKLFSTGATLYANDQQAKLAKAQAAQAAQKAADAAAAAATAPNQNSITAALQAQADAARLSYASLTTPASMGNAVAAPSSAANALDAYLPFIVIGMIALVAFIALRK